MAVLCLVWPTLHFSDFVKQGFKASGSVIMKVCLPKGSLSRPYRRKVGVKDKGEGHGAGKGWRSERCGCLVKSGNPLPHPTQPYKFSLLV